VRVVAATNRRCASTWPRARSARTCTTGSTCCGIELPPLRERRGDVPLLVRRFVTEFSARHDRPFHGISGEAMRLLVDYPWPGNVRELRNLVESMVVLAPGREVGPGDLPPHIRDADALGLAASGGGGGARLLPVPVGPLVREGQRAEGRELEFIVRGLLELKLQVEELRRRLDEERAARQELADAAAAGAFAAPGGGGLLAAAAGRRGSRRATPSRRPTPSSSPPA
jgi:DNA-binding NtrC family response regulator